MHDTIQQYDTFIEIDMYHNSYIILSVSYYIHIYIKQCMI